MKKQRKLFAVLVCISMLVLTLVPAYGVVGAEPPEDGMVAITSAEGMSDVEIAKAVGVIQGSGEGVTEEYLSTVSKRYQAAIMFLRLKGLEAEAMAFEATENFSDATTLSSSNQKVLAYLKAHPELGWVGTGDNLFDPLSDINPQQYYKVLLETLGYKANQDFDYADTITYAAANGLSKVADATEFNNENLAVATVEALKAPVNRTNINLVTFLVNEGVITKEQVDQTGLALLPGKVIAAYIPAWEKEGQENWTVDNIKGDKLTHLILSFAVVGEDGTIQNGNDINEEVLAKFAAVKEKYPHIKTMIAVGGHEADGFSDAALTEESRAKFAKSVADYVINTGVDGIDIDWEFPVNGGWGAIKARPEDKENHTYFVQAIRDELDKAEKVMNKELLLTVAANCGPAYINDWVEIEKVTEIIDFFNVMTYDIHGQWEGATGHGAPLGLSEGDKGGLSVNTSIPNFLAAGVPPEKIVVGLPFYGKYFPDVEVTDPEKKGLWEPIKDQKAVVAVGYDQVLTDYTEEKGYVRIWDEAAQSAYLWNEEESAFVTYEDPQAVAAKMEYIKFQDLGGAMFWEYTWNMSGELVTVMHETLMKPAKVIAAYIPAWEKEGQENWIVDNIKGDKLTHLILSFTVVGEDGTMQNGKDINEEVLAKLAAVKEKYPHIKTMIAVGGHEADGFSDAALTEESRAKFAKSVADYVINSGVDGIDIDWEFPVNGGWGAIKARPEDKENHTYFVQAIRDELDKAEKVMNKELLLTVAANCGPAYINDWIEIEKVTEIIDFFNVMTYDIHGQWEMATGHGAPLGLSEGDTGGLSVNTSIPNFLAAGVPPEKIVVGLPFYGKYFPDVEVADPEKKGLWEPIKDQKTVVAVGYDQVLTDYTEEKGYVRIWDEVAQSAYLWNEEESAFVTYEDPEAVAAKMAYINEQGLRGAMFWEYTWNMSGELVTVMHDTLMQ